jgi:hypothetical protein
MYITVLLQLSTRSNIFCLCVISKHIQITVFPVTLNSFYEAAVSNILR